jgi:hypothetical protein
LTWFWGEIIVNMIVDADRMSTPMSDELNGKMEDGIIWLVEQGGKENKIAVDYARRIPPFFLCFHVLPVHPFPKILMSWQVGGSAEKGSTQGIC